MRILLFVPITFLAGVHGFDLFAPYLLIVAACFPMLLRPRRARIPQPIPIQS
jgi:hypothetical protein